ncbi:MAG: 50S ribosomal protein L15 [Pirellulales bacterium]|nr:50S ribosomal protein L15 [Pirellulales bacterium]
MNLNDVHRGITKNKPRKRIGRGPGSGHGKTSTRGHKGQGSRSGYTSKAVFEGGKMPLVRRVPKRGFNNRWAETVAVVNLGVLNEHFRAGQQVSPQTLEEKGLLKGRYDLLKILGNGELTKKLEVSAHRFSRAATEKIEKAGGQTVVLPGKKPVAKNKMRS